MNSFRCRQIQQGIGFGVYNIKAVRWDITPKFVVPGGAQYNQWTFAKVWKEYGLRIQDMDQPLLEIDSAGISELQVFLVPELCQVGEVGECHVHALGLRHFLSLTVPGKRVRCESGAKTIPLGFPSEAARTPYGHCS